MKAAHNFFTLTVFRKNLQMVTLFVGFMLSPFLVFAQNTEMNPFTRKQCEDFKKQLAADARVTVSELQVPKNYKFPHKEKINLMYWTRAALVETTQYPPLLLIHGGVGGNSSGLFTWKKIMDEYPGTIVSLDLRGEGCSNFFKYLRPANQFGDVTIQATVQDLEVLRKTLYGEKRWRIFGQSRGSAIAHRYLERFPDSLESVHAHGLAMQDRQGFEEYSITRSKFNARAGRTFYSLHPEAGAVIEEIRQLLSANQHCLTVNYGADELEASARPQICGPQLVDAFSGRLSSMSGWKTFADSLIALKSSGTLDFEGAKKLLQTTIDSSLYVRYGHYIYGTNTLEFNAPDPKVLQAIDQDADLASAPLSEGRFILHVMYPLYVKMFGDNVCGSHQHYHFGKVRHSILKRKLMKDPLNVRVYMSEYDPVAGPEAFDYEKAQLSGHAQFTYIEKSAHDGWKTHPQVADDLLLAPKK